MLVRIFKSVVWFGHDRIKHIQISYCVKGWNIIVAHISHTSFQNVRFGISFCKVLVKARSYEEHTSYLSMVVRLPRGLYLFLNVKGHSGGHLVVVPPWPRFPSMRIPSTSSMVNFGSSCRKHHRRNGFVFCKNLPHSIRRGNHVSKNLEG